MHICYLDDSGSEHRRVFSLLMVHESEWHACFQQLRDMRRKIRDSDGIFVKKELHATEFVSGRGRIANQSISKARRVEIFNECLRDIAQLPKVRIINACGPKHSEMRLFERLLNRTQRAMSGWNSRALCICDEGKDYNHLLRKMGVYNPIPSRFGCWPEGETRNVTLDRIVEQLFYRRSQDSRFIQAADFCAYALLRSEEHLPSKNALGLHESVKHITPIFQTAAYGADPKKLGIIRA